VKKTTVICMSPSGKSKVRLGRLLINEQQLEQLNQFKYLGSCISDDWYATKDIRARTAMGKTQKPLQCHTAGTRIGDI